jgi:hypothetical protein
MFIGGLTSYLHYFCLFVCSSVQHILCCGFVLLPVSPDFSPFFLVPSVFSNVYLQNRIIAILSKISSENISLERSLICKIRIKYFASQYLYNANVLYFSWKCVCFIITSIILIKLSISHMLKKRFTKSNDWQLDSDYSLLENILSLCCSGVRPRISNNHVPQNL